MHRVLLIIVGCLLLGSCTTNEEPLLVFAAASTRDAIDEVLADRDGPPVVVSYASSSTLARQIEAGAPAHVFLAAHPQWMDHVEERGLVSDRRDLLANELALVVPRNAEVPTRILDLEEIDLDVLMGDGVFAMGDPDHVPAGLYGRAALEALGWWDGLAHRIARGFDARAALAFVERGEAALGLVYATDAVASDHVSLLAHVPVAHHPSITYPAAVVGVDRRDEALALLEHLASPMARAVFERHGFREP